MIQEKRWCGSAAAIIALTAVPASAQRVADNAVTIADDAFGVSIGQESSGIYSDTDTRGFSPTKAGNARIDGIYYDPVGNISQRLKRYTMIRIGFAAETYPFAAPTGIADYRFHPMPTDLGASLARSFGPYGGSLNEVDTRIPIIKGKVGLIAGLADAHVHNVDHTRTESWGYVGRLFIRSGGFEFAPFMSRAWFTAQNPPVPIVVKGTTIPDVFKVKSRLLQPWAVNRSTSDHYGATLKGTIGTDLSVRAGLFRGAGRRLENYAEIFTLLDSSDNANHRILADPVQETKSTSGEVLISLRLGSGKAVHRIFAGFRGRNRLSEAGGSDSRDFGTIRLGDYRDEPVPEFVFGPVNQGHIRQTSLMLGYLGRVEGLGGINLGVQKARYRASASNGRTGAITRSSDDPILYNITLFADLSREISVYLGHERGLEDNGLVPDSAANRSEQLPATQTTQYEGGLRWKHAGVTLAVNGFQIEKPYFASNASGNFAAVGTVRHRGAELSLSGQFGKRLHVVGGAVLLQPRLLGAATSLGTRPAGAPSVYVRIDANYHTDILGGLTPIATLFHVGKRAVGPKPAGADEQAMLPPVTFIDFGLRQNFRIGKAAASFRAVVQNVFDKGAWKVSAPNILTTDNRRRFTLALTTDL